LAVLSLYQDFSSLILRRQPMWSTRVFVPRNDASSAIIFLIMVIVNTSTNAFALDSIEVDFYPKKGFMISIS
jgi:hypothetical protein